ncbi:MAG: aldo/keto reductase [Desulfuromonadaceae bacterium]
MPATIVRLGQTGYQVPRISFGALPLQKLSHSDAVSLLRHALNNGVTFIDSAIGYGDSEEKIGAAIRNGGDRDALILATKSMARTSAGIQAHVDVSLKRTGLERIHIYQMHAINSFALLEEVTRPGGALEGLKRARDAGKIDHIAITGHRIDVLMEALRSGEYATVQAPYNFIENDAEKELIPLARQVDAGFLVMKPMGGGLLRSARLSIGYILQNTPDAVLIPGYETIAELEEIRSIDSGFSPLTVDELSEMEQIRKELGKNFCRRCNYCAPCPQDINIPMGMIMHTLVKRAGVGFFQREAGREALTRTATCQQCGVCEPRCPYNLPIRDILIRNVATVKAALKLEQ